MAHYKPSHLNLHSLHRYLYWSAGMKEFKMALRWGINMVTPRSSLCSFRCVDSFFVLFSLLDLGHPEVTRSVVTQLKGVKHSLRKMIFKGAQLLLQKLENAT